MKLITWNFWILKEHNSFSYLWKVESDILDSFGEILFEKLQNLQRMYELINVLPPSNFAVFSAIFFVTDCKELKLAQTVLINQLL